MIKYSQLQEYMLKQLEEDKNLHTIRAEGKTLEQALKEASIQLGLPVKKLEYEVSQKGGKGILGMGNTDWVILAYAAQKKEKYIVEEELGFNVDLAEQELEQKKNRDGMVCLRFQHDGVFMKVTKPKGKGMRANLQMAQRKLMNRGVTNYNQQLVGKIVKHCDGQYIKIADYDYNPVNDPIMSIDITELEMKAYLMVQAPGSGGTDLSKDNIITFLNNNNVVYGIKQDVLQEFEDNPHYNEKVLIAEGSKPINGNDAKIVYSFETDHSRLHLKEKDGKVDFKELNLIENVVAGQQLAKKVPPERGKEGTTVTGKTLPAKSGKDVKLEVGKNVKLSEDGSTAISEINGQVIILNNKINVEPVYTVSGDVNLHTGNILFLGTVIIKGSVTDGFSVKAAGNIEVMGNVGKCIIDAEGDIVVHQGILGKTEGKVKSGKNIYAKFIEHGHVEAVGNVVVTDGIIHSYVDSNKKIICQGRRASIVGGRLRAAEEINAKNLGSIAGAETILEVGYDPKSKERLVMLQGENEQIGKELEELERNINTIENLKKIQKELPEDKKKYLSELNERRLTVVNKIKENNGEITEIKNYLSTLKVKGKISASERVFPGVKICIKDVSHPIKIEQKSISYVLEGKEIRSTRYEAIDREFYYRRR